VTTSALSQQDVINCLADPATHGGQPVKTITTHISYLFLAGERCYKLKRAVDLGFLDFSTPEKRRATCETELARNSRTAPGLYLAVRPVTAAAGRLELDGDGEPVDWVVEMVRFDPEQTLDKVAQRGELTRATVLEAAEGLAAFHAAADRKPDKGGVAGMDLALHGIEDMLDAAEQNGASTEQLRALVDDLHDGLGTAARRLEARRRHGFVRLCHGDLHLGNICMFEGKPQLFDAIEFDDDIAAVDVLYDTAFTVMDLLHHRQPVFACQFFNRYLSATRDYAGLSLFPFFMRVRAAVRQASEDLATSQNPEGVEAAASHFPVLESLADRPQPRLIAIGGRSGTGKSGLAAQIASRVESLKPGAVTLNSDVIRKRLFSLTPEEELGPDGYASGVSARVYQRMIQDARRAVRAGYSVILDATFIDSTQRERAGRLALDLDVPFNGFWLEAPVEELRARVEQRKNDPSDATVSVLEKQIETDPGPISWQTIDAGRAVEESAAHMLFALAETVQS